MLKRTCLLTGILLIVPLFAHAAELSRRFVPNELIVGYTSEKDQKAALAEFQKPNGVARSADEGGVTATEVSSTVLKLHIDVPPSEARELTEPESELQTLQDYAKSLKADSRVKYAHPNWIVKLNPIEMNSVKPLLKAQSLPSGTAKPSSIENSGPNDPIYAMGLQWNFLAPPVGMNAVGAWNVLAKSPQTKGKKIIIAVLDTGIVDDQPDIAHAGHLLNGYNFVSFDTCEFRDVERNSDPADTGNLCGRNSEPSGWHGTHVAGIVGAAGTNNGQGIASIAGNADVAILPIRVLGSGSGTTKDISDAIRWAAGLPVKGVIDNRLPADVINMSLGGPIITTDGKLGVCDEDNFGELRAAISDARAAGSVIVVSAGNAEPLTDDLQSCVPSGSEDKTCKLTTFDIQNYQPSGCPGVISVAASDPHGHIAWYSNHGDVSIMAPGGDSDEKRQFSIADGKTIQLPLAVWSTIRGDNDSVPYGPMEGTSQAAPHVSGAIALALIKHPEWRGKPDIIEKELRQTASKVSADACPEPTPCGPGQLDAAALVSAP